MGTTWRCRAACRMTWQVLGTRFNRNVKRLSLLLRVTTDRFSVTNW
jgi:hypothetical protein